jgi:hypothetical protein
VTVDTSSKPVGQAFDRLVKAVQPLGNNQTPPNAARRKKRDASQTGA